MQVAQAQRVVPTTGVLVVVPVVRTVPVATAARATTTSARPVVVGQMAAVLVDRTVQL
jgi:hypothetical protein